MSFKSTIYKEVPRRWKSLLAIIAVSVLLSSWGITWGLPESWHPDESTEVARKMVLQRTLNPHAFYYGSLHYYQLAVTSVIPVRLFYLMFPAESKEEIKAATILFARMHSVLLSTLILVFVFMMGRLLFDEKIGLLAAMFYAVSMGVTNIAHFATTDIPQLFWFTAACLLSAYVYKDGGTRWYVLAGITLGLACATKYSAVFAVFALITAHILRSDRNHKALLLALILVPILFVLGNPTILLDFFEFANGFFKENAFNVARTEAAQPSFPPLMEEFINALGWPLFLLCSLGFIVSVVFLIKNIYRKEIVFIFSCFFPYYFLFAPHALSELRYTLPVIPFMMILTSLVLVWTYQQMHARMQKLISATVVLVLLYSVAYCAAADLTLINDSRYQAKQWMLEHVPVKSKVEVSRYTVGSEYSAQIPPPRILFQKRPVYSNFIVLTAKRAMDLLQHNPLFNLLKKFEAYCLENDWIHPRAPYYVAWYEAFLIGCRLQVEFFGMGIPGLHKRDPDFIAIARRPPEMPFLLELLADKANYSLVTKLHYRFSDWINPRVEAANYPIYIFQRKERDQTLALRSES